MPPSIRLLGTALLDLVLPPRCHICREVLTEPEAVHLCTSCRETLPVLKSPCCSCCGVPFEGPGDDHPCGSCLQQPPPWEHARAAFIYDHGCRDLIHAFKYQSSSHLRRPLALLSIERLTPHLLSWQPDCLVPVPLHPRRLRKRGFNQAILLAEPFAAAWQLPLHRQSLQRIRWTTPQIELNATERSVNLRGAFNVPDAAVIQGKRVVLVDDVYTTGATLAECSRTLRQAGAAAVYAITIARAPQPAA